MAGRILVSKRANAKVLFVYVIIFFVKNPSNLFHIRVVNSLTQIDKNDWYSIFPVIPENYNFFKTIEETLGDQFTPSYITIYEKQAIVCLAPCFMIDYSLDTTVEGILKKFMQWLQKKKTKLFAIKVLVCGCPMAERKIGFKYPHRPEITQALVDTMFAVGREKNAHFTAFKDFSQESLKPLKSLFKNGFHRIESYPTTELEMKFHSFDQYLGSLSKTTRKSTRRKFKEVERLPQIKMDVVKVLDETLLEEIFQLYLNTLNKSDIQFEKLTKEFFRKISQNMPNEAKFFLWRIEGKLVAFDLCLVANGIMIDEYIGLDYTVAYEYHLYHVTFRDIFNWCLQNNIRVLQGGTLNYDPKKHLDFKFNPAYILIKHRNIFINAIFGLLCIFLKPENFDPVLKSMKKKSNLFLLKIFFLIFLADTAESIADLFFKKSTLITGISDITLHNLFHFTSQLLSIPMLWVGIGVYFINFLLWIIALSKVDLSVAFPIGCTTFVIVPILSMIFLHEHVGGLQWLGIAAIIVGVFLVSKSTKQNQELL